MVALDGKPVNILIYGPPAAGKLSVARALADRFALRLLDNHATTDVALRLFGFEEPEQLRALLVRLRTELWRSAADAGLSLVSTMAFADPEDRDHVRRIVDAYESNGGRVVFVRLWPTRQALEERVNSPERAASRKLSNVAALRDILGRFDFSRLINPDDLSIDNTSLGVEAVADRIAAHFRFP